MPYDFDQIIDRRNTDSIKFDFARKYGKPEGLLPLWVADMDFRVPDCVLQALEKRIEHGIFGYAQNRESYFEAVKNWHEQSFGWTAQPEWLVETPGVVYAICTALRALTKKGDAVLIQPPVYYPFANSILANERKLVENQLVYRDGKYGIDFADFERKIAENDVKMFVLCSPHNPVGRVWTKEELLRMGEILHAHDVIVVSDEVHADFLYEGHTHTMFASLSSEIGRRTITCTAPSKTFNLAGLQTSNIFIQDEQMRREFKKEIHRTGYSHLNTMGMAACEAAYAGGRPWLEELLVYLTGNLAYIREFLSANLPEIRLVEPEGTYLVWLDCRGLSMSDAELKVFVEEKAGLWLDEGTMFGAGGEGFLRVNITSPRPVIQQAFKQLDNAIKNR